MKIKQYFSILKLYKKGLLIGAATGAIAAYYALSQGVDLNTITNAGKGLIDNIMARNSSLEVASYKMYGVFMFVGASMGMIIEWAVNKYFPKR